MGVATAPFADEAIEQARRLGMPDCRVVYVPHPVQLLTDDELAARADAAFPAVLAALTEPPRVQPMITDTFRRHAHAIVRDHGGAG